MWLAMRQFDLDAVAGLADAIHPTLPEDVSVFANRLALFPKGCLVLRADDNELSDPPIRGYAVAHPWRGDIPPKLNTVLDALPANPDRFYIHDVVVSPSCRGSGHAARVVDEFLILAEAFPAAMLVSVYGTVPFWSRFGFREASGTLPPGGLDAYGEDARFMIRTPPK